MIRASMMSADAVGSTACEVIAQVIAESLEAACRLQG
jgi:hypothetical protein